MSIKVKLRIFKEKDIDTIHDIIKNIETDDFYFIIKKFIPETIKFINHSIQKLKAEGINIPVVDMTPKSILQYLYLEESYMRNIFLRCFDCFINLRENPRNYTCVDELNLQEIIYCKCKPFECTHIVNYLSPRGYNNIVKTWLHTVSPTINLELLDKKSDFIKKDMIIKAFLDAMTYPSKRTKRKIVRTVNRFIRELMEQIISARIRGHIIKIFMEIHGDLPPPLMD